MFELAPENNPVAIVKTNVLELSFDELKQWFIKHGEKPFRAEQLFMALHEQGAQSFDEITNLSKDLREKLKEYFELHSVRIESVKQSQDGTRKYQLRTWDNHIIESVFIPNASRDGRHTICISSQVGCAMGCTFCATAALKLTRHLTASEIVSQVYVVHKDVKTLGLLASIDEEDSPKASKKARWIHNIVYMGMGEPLHNYENVKHSIDILRSERGMFYSPRRITVSTSGVVKNLKRLGEETDVHVAISLNSSTNEQRNLAMPVNLKWNIQDLLQACKEFDLKPRRRITFEYVMLAGVNDSDEDAQRVVALLKDFRCKVNLIPFNEHPLSPFKRPSYERVQSFQTILQEAHMTVFVRTTRGDDIDAACGMLGAKKLEQKRLTIVQ